MFGNFLSTFLSDFANAFVIIPRVEYNIYSQNTTSKET